MRRVKKDFTCENLKTKRSLVLQEIGLISVGVALKGDILDEFALLKCLKSMLLYSCFTQQDTEINNSVFSFGHSQNVII